MFLSLQLRTPDGRVGGRWRPRERQEGVEQGLWMKLGRGDCSETRDVGKMLARSAEVGEAKRAEKANSRPYV